MSLYDQARQRYAELFGSPKRVIDLSRIPDSELHLWLCSSAQWWREHSRRRPRIATDLDRIAADLEASLLNETA